FPDLIVPAGFTSDRLPVGISFFGRPFSEPTLLGLGYAFEQATRARRDPAHTPPLPGERVGPRGRGRRGPDRGEGGRSFSPWPPRGWPRRRPGPRAPRRRSPARTELRPTSRERWWT